MKLLDGAAVSIFNVRRDEKISSYLFGRCRPGGAEPASPVMAACEQGAETPLYLWCDYAALEFERRDGSMDRETTHWRRRDDREAGREDPDRAREMVIRALKDQGVTHIFGYPGGAVLPIYDALFADNGITHVLVRHEQGATHAAEGYARSTGKPGVVLVTSGPGATNAVTGLTDALMDSIPLVVLTGQVATHLIGTDAFQECDTVGITRALHQAQLAGEGRERSVARAARGLPDRHHRPSRPGGGGHSQGRAVQDRRLSRRRTQCITAPIVPRPSRTRRDRQGGGDDGGGQAADLLYRRRHHQFRARKPAALLRELVDADRLSHHLDPDGAGRLSGVRRRNGWACWACTAPTKPTTPCMIAT